MKTCLFQCKRIKEPEINPHSYSHLIFDKGAIYIGEKTASSTNGAGKTGYLYAED
jgi:hypothetical protein